MVEPMSERLTKSDWVRHGLRTLAKEGVGALKVGPMATALNVSRGSFYWHFRDISDFRAQILQSWRDSTTEQVIQDLEAEGPGPGRLKTLLRRSLDGRLSLDLAIRSWAAGDAAVAEVVASVDDRRVGHIADMLVATGVEPGTALQRAAFLYWAYLGRAMVMDPRHASIEPSTMDDIAALFEG